MKIRFSKWDHYDVIAVTCLLAGYFAGVIEGMDISFWYTVIPVIVLGGIAGIVRKKYGK